MRRGASLFLLLMAAAARAARLETAVEPREVRVGDPLTLTVTLVTDPGEMPLPFEPEKALGPFELAGFQEVKGAEAATHVLTLRTFEVDAATVPALTFRYRDAAGRERALKTPEIPVPVKSVLPPKGGGLRDARGTLRAPPGAWKPWAAALAALASVGFLLWQLHARRRSWSADAPAVPSRPPEETALAALEALETLLEGPAKPYYSRLSEIFRAYVEARFGRPALDRTTSEMVPLLKDLCPDAEERRALRDLLETADLAKFARFESPPDERRRHRDRAATFVRATTPREPEAAA